MAIPRVIEPQTNGAYGTLSADYAVSDVALQLNTSEGTRFADTTTGGSFAVCVFDPTFAHYAAARAAGKAEDLIVTARSGDLLTVLRGQQGTTPIALGRNWVVAAYHSKLNQDTINRALQGTSYNFSAQYHGLDPDGAVDNVAAFATAFQQVGSGNHLRLKPGTYRVASSMNMASVVFEPGAKLSIDTGATVTFQGHIGAGRHQIFSGSGSVTFQASAARLKRVYPEWWGAFTSTSSVSCQTEMQKCFTAVAGSARTKEISFSAGEYFVRSLSLSTDTNPIRLVGAGKRSTTLRQTVAVPGDGAGLLFCTGAGQKGPELHRLILQGDLSGGHVVDIVNCQEPVIEDCQITNGSNGFAALRIRGGVTRLSAQRLRFHCASTNHPSYLIWIGSGGVDFPTDTNLYFSEISTYSMSSGQAFENTIPIFLDNAGGCVFERSKLDGLRNGAKNVYIKGGLAFIFFNFFFEQQATVAIDFHFEDTSMIFASRCAAGSDEKPVAFKLDNAKSVYWANSYIQKEIQSNGTSDAVQFDNCDLGDNVTFAGTRSAYPFLKIRDSKTVNSVRAVTGYHLTGPDNQWTLKKNSGATGSIETEQNLQIGAAAQGTWNTPHLILGDYHIFLGSTGKLLKKLGAPASADDGTVVGAET